jgi:hypothetical protein
LTVTGELWGYEVFEQWEGESLVAFSKAFLAEGETGWKTVTPELEHFVLDTRNYSMMDSSGRGEEENLEKLTKMCRYQGLECTLLQSEIQFD